MNGTGYECLNCELMGDCAETDAQKTRENYYCERWKAAPNAVVAARGQILQDFGDQGLQSILTTKPKGR